MSRFSWRKHLCKDIQCLEKHIWICWNFFHNSQTCQSKITQCKYLWVTLQAAFLSSLPHSKSMKRQDLQANAEKLLKCDWHLKETVSKACMTQCWNTVRLIKVMAVGYHRGLPYVYLFNLIHTLSGFIITLCSPSSISPPVCIIGCKLLLQLLFRNEDVECRYYWGFYG